MKLSRQTMANWILNVSDTWLRPIYDALHQKLCCETVLHGDETTLQMLKESGKAATSKSYMLLYRTSGCAENPIVLYEYQPSRKAEHAERFPKGFSGWLHADGYQGYHWHGQMRPREKPRRNLRWERRCTICWNNGRT